VSPAQNEKTAPEGTARDAERYFQLAVMLTRANELAGSSHPNMIADDHPVLQG